MRKWIPLTLAAFLAVLLLVAPGCGGGATAATPGDGTSTWNEMVWNQDAWGPEAP